MALRVLLARIVGFFRRGEGALDTDIAAHLDLLMSEHLARGMSQQDATLAARRRFGSLQHTRDLCRDQRSLPVLEMVRQDARIACRSLWRDPRFTFAAVLTLGLGIGLTTAAFSVVDTVLIRSLPYNGAERIVLLGSKSLDANAMTGEVFHYVRERLTGFERIASHRGGGNGWNLVVGNRAEYVRGLAISQGYLQVFGATPLIGRDFQPEEDSPKGQLAVLISEGLWQRYFDRRPEAIGQLVQLGGRPYTVVGVIPQTFQSIPPADVWTPLQVSRQDSTLNYAVVGRLETGQSLAAAVARLEVLKSAMAQDVRGTGKNFPDRVAQMVWVPFQTAVTASNRFVLQLVLGTTAMVLLIACANVAALQLVRTIRRGREWATRVALGGARRRIGCQVLTESIVVGGVAAGVGILVAFTGLQVVMPFVSSDVLAGRVVRLDWRILSTTAVVALITSVSSGMWPAVTVGRLDYRAAIGADARGTTATRRQHWLRRAFVIAQVAAATVLLVGAGLFLRTLTTAARVDLGFDPDRVVLGQMSLQGTASEFASFYERTLEQLRQVPGVEVAAVGNNVPIERGLNLPILPTGRIREMRSIDWRYVTPDYFKALGVALRAGRVFEPSDTMAAPRTAVVNEAFATAYFGDARRALGEAVSLVPAYGDMPWQIVGVVADVRTRAGTGWTRGHALAAPGAPTLFVPVSQVPERLAATAHGPFPVNWIVRTRSATATVVPAVEEVMRREAPTLPMIRFIPMQQVIDEALQLQHLLWRVLGLFAAIALSLAAFGLYSLLSYAVVQRTKEIGISMALGATVSRVVGGFLREGLLLATAGVVMGLVTAIGVSRLVTRFIFGVAPADPTAIATTAVLLLMVAALASLVPARRAARVDPMIALRCD